MTVNNIIYFDIESTGPVAVEDRICQLATMHVDSAGKITRKVSLINPERPISPQATEVHGITNEMVQGAPTFKQVAKALKALFEGKILCGYNIIRFDIPMLVEEFGRVGIDIDLSGCKIVDVMKLETELNPRTLGAVYKRYTGIDLDGAHDAMNDVNATNKILLAQLQAIESKGLSSDELLEKSGIPKDAADLYGKLKWNEQGELVYTFGKNKDKRVVDDMAYIDYIMKEPFPAQVKALIRKEVQKQVQAAFKKS